jgi:hypothetical protein
MDKNGSDGNSFDWGRWWWFWTTLHCFAIKDEEGLDDPCEDACLCWSFIFTLIIRNVICEVNGLSRNSIEIQLQI